MPILLIFLVKIFSLKSNIQWFKLRLFFFCAISGLLIPTTASCQKDSVRIELDKAIDIISDLSDSIFSNKAVIEYSLPEGYRQFNTYLKEEMAIKYKVSYQSIFQNASESLTEKNTAWGGWFLFQFYWTAFNRDKNWEGKLIASFDARHTINPGVNSAPGLFRNDIGSLWAPEGAYFDWDIYPAILMWQQTVVKSRFAFRIGQQQALSVIDFFRFADSRTSFSNTQLVFPVGYIPVGPPGLGFSFKWWPVQSADLYVKGVINDINAPAGKLDWSGIFETGEIFAGLEIGYDFIRNKYDFDHIHLTLWYGDEVSTVPWDTKAGWGFKIHGSKQWSRFVGYSNYAYNTSEGGAFNYTNIKQAINAGVAYINPLKIQGELALGFSWAEPIEQDLRNQYGIESYWKLLITPNLWLTPGIHLLWDPTFNLEQDLISIYQIKARIFINN